MGNKLKNSKALREARAEIERIGGVYLGAKPLKKHLIVEFTMHGVTCTEMVCGSANGRYDAPNRRRVLRQRFARGNT